MTEVNYGSFPIICYICKLQLKVLINIHVIIPCQQIKKINYVNKLNGNNHFLNSQINIIAAGCLLKSFITLFGHVIIFI